MWIERLELHNYRQYRTADVKFAPPGPKGFTIIQGANGAGKTNLLNAIAWCLYDQEYYLNREYEGLPVYHVPPEGDETDYVPDFVQVRIHLCGDGNKKYVISRRLNLRKDSGGKIIPVPAPGLGNEDGSVLKFLRLKGDDQESLTDPEQHVEEMLPSGIRDYFLFDGERLNSYFQETSGKQIRQAVFDVSQLELLDRLIDHLQRRHDEFYRKTRALSPGATEARENYDAAKATADKASGDLKLREAERDEADRQLRDITAAMKGMAPDDAAKKQHRRDELDAEIPRIGEELKTAELAKRKFLYSMAPTIVAIDALMDYKSEISKTAESGLIPPDYTRTFLRKLLRDRKCICGSDLSEGSTQCNSVKSHLAGIDKISDLSTELIKEGVRVNSLLNEVRTFSPKLQSLNRTIDDLGARLLASERELKQIQKDLGNTSFEKYNALQSRAIQYREARDHALEEIGGLKVDRDTATQAAERYKTELEGELKKAGKHKELLDLVHFCEAGLSAAQKVKDTITTIVRKEVEAQTKEYFMSLIWKRNTYTDTKIDEDYKVTVEHQSGREALGTLSMGERQVLALSFVAALNRVSGFDMPLVIDSPLGKISQEPKLSIAQNLPNYLKGKQVVLLVTEEEYTDSVRDALRPSVGQEWRISYREGAGGADAKVIKYGE